MSTEKEILRAIFVMAENEIGKWDINNHFNTLEGHYDGDGWWIPIKYKQEVDDLCKQANMTCVETELPERDWPTFLEKNKIAFLKKKLVKEKHNLIQLEQSGISKESKQYIKSLLEIKKIERNINYKENKLHIAAIPLPKLEENSFSYLLKNNSEQQLINDLKNISSGITTGYTIGDVDLKFPGGSLSIIAAPTSHGKTAALINFSLGALKNDPSASVYFFTYEESSSSINTLFLNTFIGEPLSKNNRESITSYFRENNTQYIISNKQNEFIESKNNFFNTLINNGRLRIFYTDMTGEQLVESIKFIKNNTNVGLICIDYIQLINMPKDFSGNRQEELKEICRALKDCAIETGLPIVSTAQFNRTVVTEADLSPVNIGEAGDIERFANLIIGMFNRKFVMTKEGNKKRDGTNIEPEPTIYFEILKGRRIGNGHNTVMDFEGNTGVISNKDAHPLDTFENMGKKIGNKN